MTTLSDVVRAQTDAAPTIVVSGLHTETIAAGATATISANISGGIPVSAVNGTFAGYMVFFFYGQTGANGTLGYDKKIIAPPVGCSTRDLVCTVPDNITFTHTYDHVGSYDTSLTVYDAVGDYSIATSVVNVIPPSLSVHANASLMRTAEDSPILFSANVSTNPAADMSDGFTYEWSFGDNTTSWGDPVEHAYGQSGTYVANVEAFDNTTGARNQSSVSGIRITNPAPVAHLTILTPTTTPSSFSENTTIQFSGEGTTDLATDSPNLRYFWNFGDGAEGAGFLVSHVYTETGTFLVRLTVTDEEGLQSTAAVTVRITNTGPLPFASTSPVSVGTVALLSANGTLDVPVDLPAENYTWSSAVPLVTDMGTSFGLTGRQGYFAPGNYTASLLVTNSEGLTATTNVTVPVQDAPPNIGVYSMYTVANLTFQVMGTPGNVLGVRVLENGHTVASGEVTRSRGTPNYLNLTDVPFSLADNDTIQMQYLSLARNVHLQGAVDANPVNLTVNFSNDGPTCLSLYSSAVCSSQLYNHTFNPLVPSTAVWNVSASAASVGQLVFLDAQVFSPGRTNLTTTWQFGDGSTLTSTTPAPSVPEPTLANLTAEHRWAPGDNYTFTMSVTDGAPTPLTNHSTVRVTEVAQAQVSDLAPIVALAVPSWEPAAAANTMGAVVSSEQYSASSFTLFWHFGDGHGAAHIGVDVSSNETHVFEYSATRYAVVVYATDSVGGPATVSWQFLTIVNAPPVPSFTAPSGPMPELSQITFNASGSVDYNGGRLGAGLSYSWDFGDNLPGVGGSRGEGSVTAHVFTKEGTFPVTLTVTDAEGLSASLTKNVTIGDRSIHASLANRTVTVDQFTVFSLENLSGAATDLARLNATWSWGDGSTGAGLVSGHTYLTPGTYRVNATLASEDARPLKTLSATVTVVDSTLSVSLPYEGYVIYGENHSMTFHATVLASAADASLPPGSFTYLWSFGDNTTGTTFGGLTGTASHVYSMSGNPQLSVVVEGPGGASASASVSLVSIPNWDGDGIPDAYATAVLHLPAGNDPGHGVGLTDFMSQFVVHAQPTTGQTTGDGLTAFQDVFGTVTGYVGNPLDSNVAGDGLLNGAHEFSDSFTAPKVVQFNGSGSTPIPGVFHPTFLNAASLRSVALYVEVVSSDLANLTLNLTDLAPGHSGTFAALGSLSAPVQNWTLLNNTPTGGPMSNYSLTIPDFQTNSTWNLTVSGGNGTIQSASIVITYYTNPNRADPFGSGLLLGGTLSIPVFNTSEPVNANYTVFNGQTFTYSSVYYYPFTEQYYKLSVVQGLPYYPWDNASYHANNNTSYLGAPVGDPHAFATYYGDKEFGIAPWQVHAAGDTGLTNGMKAYGRLVYDLTANRYLAPLSPTDVGLFDISQAPPPYPKDQLAYAGPLNPTALSTGTSGVPDSRSINPVGGPEVFGVTVTAGWSECVLQGLTLLKPAYGQGVISNLNVTNSSGAAATVFTTSVVADNYSYSSSGACYSWHFTFNAHYQIPANTAEAVNTLRLGIDFSNAFDNAYGGSVDFSVSTNPARGVQNLSGEIGTCATFCISGSAVALPLNRTPVTLVSAKQEVHQLPGYGPHWHGDQHFYALYLNVTGPTNDTPFAPGINLVLVSGTAFASSPFNTSLSQGNTSSLPFLGNSTFSRRGNSSDTYILGTLNATLNGSDALQLLGALLPRNATTGNLSGEYLALNQTQFELLGLAGQVMSASPYVPYPGTYYSPKSATPPTTVIDVLIEVLTIVWDEFVSVVLAIANFFAQLVEEIGQAIIGAWNQFVSAVQSAINAIVKAFDFIIEWLNEQFAALKQDINNAMNQLGGAIVAKMVLPMVSLLYDAGILSGATYNSTYQYLATKYNITDPAALDSNDSQARLAAIINIVTAVLTAIAVVIGVVLYIVGICTVGIGEAAEEAVQAGGLVITFSIAGAVSGIILSSLAFLAGIVGSIFTIASSINSNALNTWFNSTFGNTLGTSLADVLTIVTGLGLAAGDAILANAIEGLSGFYIAGAVLTVIGIILAGIAFGLAAAGVSPATQIALFVFALIATLVGGFVPLLPQCLGIEEASKTLLMGIGIAVFAFAGVAAIVGGLAGAIHDLQNP